VLLKKIFATEDVRVIVLHIIQLTQGAEKAWQMAKVDIE
jgi:hypothetical protein